MEHNNPSIYIKEFRDFINTHRCKQGDNITHTSLDGGKYCFEGIDYQHFMKHYIKVVRECPDYDLHFVERPNSHGVSPFLVDVDFDHKDAKRLYDDEHIKEIIKKINNFLREKFQVSEEQLTSFVTEKPKPTKRINKINSDDYKDGFHIYYPDLPLDEKSRYYVTDYLIGLMKNKEFLEDVLYTSNPDNIFDTSIIKNNGILMMGSKKKGGYPYTLTNVYNSNLKSMNKDEYDEEELIYTLSNQRYDEHASVEPIDSPEIMKEIDTVNSNYNGGNKKKDKIKKENCDRSIDSHDEEDDNQQPVSKFDSPIQKSKHTPAKVRDIELARKLCGILSKIRAHDYKSWMRVGFALRAVDETLYPDFVAFSKKDRQKYNEGKVTCESVWEKAKEFCQFYSIGSIRHWAKCDNNKLYYDIIRELNDEAFGKAETLKHVDIAQVVYELYKDRFVCIDREKKKWFEFQGHKWVVVQSAYTLENLISDEVRIMLAKYCSEKLGEVANGEDGFNRDIGYKKYGNMMKAVENLGDVKFRANIIAACSNLFFDADFQNKLNSNIYLIGFNNGIYDLKEMCFRDGLPSDYVSMTVGYDWKDYRHDDPIFNRINKFFREVQTEDDMREYLFGFIASVFRGIPDQKVHIWTGSGGNGKSAVVNLIKTILGQYFGVVPITLLTRKRGNSSSATPELADKFGRRLLVVQEPEHNDVIYVGQMKEYSGKDTIQARPLYGDPFEYVPQFKMVMTCNNLPHIPANDDGVWRRLRVTPFESRFVDENPVGDRQFLKDEELEEDFPKWTQAFMWLILTKYYPIYDAGIDGKKYKIKEPEKVKQFTKNYKMDSDVYMEFLDENIAKSENKKDTVSISFLYDTFRQWYKGSYTEAAPPKKNFVAYLTKCEYTIDKQQIYNVKYALGLQ